MKSYENEVYWKILVKNIVWLRMHYDFSEDKMAVIMGVSTEILKKVENGEIPSELTAEALIRLGNFFCVEPKELFNKDFGKAKWKI